MAPVPKKKHTRSATGIRRKNKKPSLPNLVRCPHCGSLMYPHKACPSCGKYKK
jgi:large subunit ribosomal protein L32